MSAEKNVYALPGAKIQTREPDEDLVRILEEVLEMAKSGQLRSFIGTGFTAEGLRLAVWSYQDAECYEMMGAITWLEHEFADRVHERIGR